jgi:hypothetical protein
MAAQAADPILLRSSRPAARQPASSIWMTIMLVQMCFTDRLQLLRVDSKNEAAHIGGALLDSICAPFLRSGRLDPAGAIMHHRSDQRAARK